MREWIGLSAYWITGKTDTFLPGPTPAIKRAAAVAP
jgi:hypothetical protein